MSRKLTINFGPESITQDPSREKGLEERKKKLGHQFGGY